MTGGQIDITLHRALADERRREIVEELGASQSGCDVIELSGRLGLHPNTIRWHLGILGDAGIVDSHPVVRSTPGRPRIVYTLRREAVDDGREAYRLLATILAGTVAAGPGAAARVEEAGRAGGRCLVSRPSPGTALREEEAVEAIVKLLDEQGFAPDAEGRELRMRRCPFHDLAEQYPDVVCAAHRGLISGALTGLGSGLEVADLQVFVEPDLCIARLGSCRASS
jgi:predicted ArsR family transcriptional regulator